MIINRQDKELSIQINLSGFSFSINTPQIKTAQTVNTYNFDAKLLNYYHLNTIAEWSMPQVMILPFDIFDNSATENYLQSAHLINEKTQRPMFAVSGELVALWAVDKKLYEILNAKIINLQHTHSLLKLLNTNQLKHNATSIYIDPAQLMHIAMWGEAGLEMAQSIVVNSPEDILFYVKLLSEKKHSLTQNITITGVVSNQDITLLKSYYPHLQRF